MGEPWRNRWARAIADGHIPASAAIKAGLAPSRTRGLPGTKMKGILAGPPFWINVEHQGCRCEDRAKQMDIWGVDGCRKNRDTIVAWLVESAKTNGWPFAPLVAPLLVDRAISLAASDEENA